MTSDSHIPNLESNSARTDAGSNSHISDLEVNPPVADNKKSNFGISDADSHDIIPDAELNSVLDYLQSNPAPTDAESVSMFEDVDLDINSPESVTSENRLKNHIQVQFKTEGEKLLVILPTESQIPASEVAWSDIWQQLKLRLNAGDRFRTSRTPVHLLAKDRLLDGRQLQEFAEAFSEAQLDLKCVVTSRRQTAIAAVTSGYSVEQLQPEIGVENCDYNPSRCPISGNDSPFGDRNSSSWHSDYFRRYQSRWYRSRRRRYCNMGATTWNCSCGCWRQS
jgi:septum site-determining protein MinC